MPSPEGSVRRMDSPAPNTEMAVLAQRWATILASIPDLLIILSADGYVEYVSPSSTKLLGIAPEYAIGHSACEFIPPDDRRNCARWLAHAQATSDLPEIVHGLVHRDGTVSSFESNIRLLPDSGSRVIIVCRNVAERETVDHQLAAMEKMWIDIYDIVREGVLVVDAASTIISINQPAADLLGTGHDELVGRRIDDLIRTPERASGRGSADLVRSLGRRERRRTVDITTPSGEVRAVRAYAMQLPHSATEDRAAVVAVVLDPEPNFVGEEAPNHSPDRDFSLDDVLSPREIEVLRLLTQGLDVRAVSSHLGISIHTTRNYVKSVLHKLDVRTQLQAVVVAIRYGLLDL
jgi:PAS domain S-box-containing protein